MVTHGNGNLLKVLKFKFDSFVIHSQVCDRMHAERQHGINFFFSELSLCNWYKISIVSLWDSNRLLLPCVFSPLFLKLYPLFPLNRSDFKWKTLLTHIFKSWRVIWTRQSQGRWVPRLAGYPVPSLVHSAAAAFPSPSERLLSRISLQLRKYCAQGW